MFKQFTENISGHENYLLFSLFMFLAFFIVVAVMLFRTKKAHIDHMSEMPLADNSIDVPNTH